MTTCHHFASASLPIVPNAYNLRAQCVSCVLPCLCLVIFLPSYVSFPLLGVAPRWIQQTLYVLESSCFGPFASHPSMGGHRTYGGTFGPLFGGPYRNLYRRCLNEGEPVLISNSTLRRFRLFHKLSVSENEFKKRKRLSEEVEHLRPFKKRAIVLEDQFDAQRTELEASKKQADKYHRWFNEERRRSYSLVVENKKLKAKIKNLRVRVVRQRARAVHWREKMKAWGARQRAKAKLLFSFRKSHSVRHNFLRIVLWYLG